MPTNAASSDSRFGLVLAQEWVVFFLRGSSSCAAGLFRTSTRKPPALPASMARFAAWAAGRRQTCPAPRCRLTADGQAAKPVETRAGGHRGRPGATLPEQRHAGPEF